MNAHIRWIILIIAVFTLIAFPSLVQANVSNNGDITVSPSRDPVGTGEGFNFFVQAIDDGSGVSAGTIQFTLSGAGVGQITGISGQGNCSVTGTLTAQCTNVDIVSGGTVSWLVDVQANSDPNQCGAGQETITLTAGFDNEPDSTIDATNSGSTSCDGTPTAVILSSLTASSAANPLATMAVFGLTGTAAAAFVWRRRR